MIEILAVFAVWRLTSLLYQEDGPWGVFERMRKEKFIKSLTGFDPTECFWCLSLWVAIPFALFIGQNGTEFVVYWLGLSGAAILINQIIDKIDI